MRYGPIDKQIDVPQDVANALAGGTLAIFAGAGISYDPPSNYPDFKGLAKEAQTTFQSTDSEFDPVDQFFGRLDRAFPNRVHPWVRDRLSGNDSSHNPNHTTLLRLFGTRERVRIVTTNFDPHFSTAGTELFNGKSSIEEFAAPALPVGSNFNGLVYLHGKVTTPANRLVLTDYDFGRAYLTEGWACRFLIDLFRTYTVLFVGYSGADTVVQYLARGLSPEGKKAFAFAASEEDANRWQTLHITPIRYPGEGASHDHSTLWSGLSLLADDIGRNVLDHERRACALLTQAPPKTNTEENDFLVSVFAHPQRIVYFNRYANSWLWAEWADQQGLLKEAFDPVAKETDHLRLVCCWLAQRMLANDNEAAFRLFLHYDCVVCITLWQALISELGRNGDLAKPHVRAMIAMLLAARPLQVSDNIFCLYELAQKLTPGVSPDLCLTIFRHLTVPHLSGRVWQSHLSDPTTLTIEYDIRFSEQGESILLLWKNVFEHDLSRFARPIIAACADTLTTNRYLWNLAQTNVANWDQITVERSEIATTPQYFAHKTVHVLLNILLECLKWLQVNASEERSAWIRIWMGSEAPILRQIGVWTLTQHLDCSPEAMLKIVIERKWLLDHGISHDLSGLLQAVFPACDESARIYFLDGAMEQFVQEECSLIKKEGYADRQIFKLLCSVATTCQPSSATVTERLANIQAKYPEWRYLPRNARTIQTHNTFAHESPISVEALLSASPAVHLELLCTFKDGDPFEQGPTRVNLCQTVAQAVKQKPAWGIELGTLLQKKGAEVPDDLWHAVVQGLRDTEMDESQWTSVLSLFTNVSLPATVLCQIAFFLSNQLERREGLLPDSCLPATLTLCKRLWTLSEGEDIPSAAPNTQRDWGSKAVCRTAGVVVQCILIMALREHKSAPDKWQGLPPHYRDMLDPVLTAPGDRGRLGKVMLAIFLAYFLSLDERWTKTKLLPLFDRNRDAEESKRAWDSFGKQGRVFSDVTHVLLPLYMDNLARWEDLHSDALHGLSRFYIFALLWGRLPANDRKQYAASMATRAGIKLRTSFAEQLGFTLRELEHDVKEENWQSWICPYLAMRIASPQSPATGAELRLFAAWAPNVSAFPNFVTEITRSSGQLDQGLNFPLCMFKKSDHTQRFPSETVKFLTWLLRHIGPGMSLAHAVDELAQTLVDMPDPPEGMDDLLITMGEKGSSTAKPLHDSLLKKRTAHLASS